MKWIITNCTRAQFSSNEEDVVYVVKVRSLFWLLVGDLKFYEST